tara:strand:+ start:332 stop:1021 length:690 start_codon:yes stop_codon:yes gene_type:complete
MQIKTAIILCAGFGKRLMPLTQNIPKPLIEINGITLLENTINLVKKLGIKSVKLNCFYLKNKIKEFINSKNFDLDIEIIDEGEKILDTGGGILNIINGSDQSDFLILNPDTIWNLNYVNEIKAMEQVYFESNSKNILMVVKKEKSFDKRFKGDFILIENILFKEENNNFIFTGSQIINKDVFKDVTKKYFSINDIWDNNIKNKKLFGFESQKDFIHLTDIEIYKKIINN